MGLEVSRLNHVVSRIKSTDASITIKPVGGVGVVDLSVAVAPAISQIPYVEQATEPILATPPAGRCTMTIWKNTTDGRFWFVVRNPADEQTKVETA